MDKRKQSTEGGLSGEGDSGKEGFFGGFWKNPKIVDVYVISDLKLEGKDGDYIIFKSMEVACTERPAMVANLILPAISLSHVNYMIKNWNRVSCS